MESAWSNGKPADRCRHGYTSAARPEPCRPKNTYVGLDQILPHLTALAILHAGCGEAQDGGAVPVTAPAEAAGLIDQLRASGVTLTYDPDTPPSAPATARALRSLRAGTADAAGTTPRD